MTKVSKGMSRISKGTIQYSKGVNLISKDKINTNDTLYLDTSGKILSHIPFEKAKEVFAMSGSYTGLTGKVNSLKGIWRYESISKNKQETWRG